MLMHFGMAFVTTGEKIKQGERVDDATLLDFA
jgi:hypothetical protein